MKFARPLPTLTVLAVLAMAGCKAPDLIIEEKPDGVTLYAPEPWFTQTGIASWYGGRWIGRLTANGERYKANDMTAAHKKLPFNTKVRVTDLKTGRQVIVRINNRGPFIRGRIIDLSVAAAKKLGTYDRGIARVKIEALKEIPPAGPPNLSTARVQKKPDAPQPRPADRL